MDMDIDPNFTDTYQTDWCHLAAILVANGIPELIHQRSINARNHVVFTFPERQRCEEILAKAIRDKNLIAFYQDFVRQSKDFMSSGRGMK